MEFIIRLTHYDMLWYDYDYDYDFDMIMIMIMI